MFTRPGSRRQNGKLRMSRQGFLGSMDVPGNNWTLVARWAPGMVGWKMCFGGLTSWPNGIPKWIPNGIPSGFQVDSQFLNLRSSNFDCPFLFDPILSLPHERAQVSFTLQGESRSMCPFFWLWGVGCWSWLLGLLHPKKKTDKIY